MTVKGNIDLDKRPIVQNADGTISTVRSIGVNVDGKEVLIPTVSEDGRLMTNKEAVSEYRRTGKHLGMFASPEASDAYAESLHEDQAGQYKNRSVLESLINAHDVATPVGQKSLEKKIFQKIIDFRKQSKSMEPDEKSRMDKLIAKYSNSLVSK